MRIKAKQSEVVEIRLNHNKEDEGGLLKKLLGGGYKILENRCDGENHSVIIAEQVTARPRYSAVFKKNDCGKKVFEDFRIAGKRFKIIK